jgi:hypothetical protein
MADSAEKGQDDLEGKEVEDNEFELMFGKASEEDADLTDLSKPDDTKTPEELEAEKKAAEEAEGKTPEELEAEKKADEKTPEELEAEKKATEEADALKVERDVAAKVQQDADAATAKAAKDAADAKAKEITDDRDKRATLADDEEALIAEAAKDFPDAAKVRVIQERITDAKWEKKFADFQENLIKELQPTVKTVQAVAIDSWERQVFDKHSDTVELLPEVEKWVAQQPKFLQAGYNSVLDKGTAAETIELMDTFKSATGRTEESAAAAKKADEEKVAADKKAAEDAEKEKKLASQEGIRGRQDSKTDTAPSTFEDAFKEEAGKDVIF